MTETITHGIIGEVDQPNTPMSIGRAATEYAIRITDDDGKPTEVGDTGNLSIKGVPGLSLFKEYLHNEKATRESFRRARLFPDRRPRHPARARLYPVRRPRQGHAEGRRRERRGVRDRAGHCGGARRARSRRGRQEASDAGRGAGRLHHPAIRRRKCRRTCTTPSCPPAASNLADFKVPREIRFVDEMPRSTLEKVAKAELRKMLA